jgi:ubiquinone/menaquinone biosynthesis C-methylase UbiE
MWNHASADRFTQYYAETSRSAATLQRFRSIRNRVLGVVDHGSSKRVLYVADIGCGAGTQSLIWAEMGHKVYGLEVNEPLLELARGRSAEAGYSIDFQLGSATNLPWPDESLDICLMIELLEHVAEWEACLRECARVLRPNGVLVLITSNKLCPVQREFNLPLYSWYPKSMKRYLERLAMTTRPDLANYATYPAVNWFSFFTLREFLVPLGFRLLDRFDVMDLSNKGRVAKWVIRSIQAVLILRWLAHVASVGTMLIGIKKAAD